MTRIANGAVELDQAELTWFAEHYGDTEWIVYFPGMDEITTHDRHYPGDEVDGEPFTEETVRAYLAEFDGRFGPGSPMAREVHKPSYAVALHHGVPAFGSHEHSYPINPPGGSFAHPGDCACGSPYADVEAANEREIAAIEWAVYVQGLGVLTREDNNPDSPLFTEETARRYAAWANAEMAWALRGEANSAVVLHHGVPVETAGA